MSNTHVKVVLLAVGINRNGEGKGKCKGVNIVGVLYMHA
jgi:hypothetical protein